MKPEEREEVEELANKLKAADSSTTLVEVVTTIVEKSREQRVNRANKNVEASTEEE